MTTPDERKRLVDERLAETGGTLDEQTGVVREKIAAAHPRSLSRVGFIALFDEALGVQHLRAPDALVRLLDDFEKQEWDAHEAS